MTIDNQVDHLRLGHGSSVTADPETAAAECVREALGGRTPGPDDLVLVFPTIEYDPHRFFPAATRAAGAAQVIGCTSYYGFTSDASVPTGAVAAYVPAGDLTFGVAAQDAIGTDIYRAAEHVTELACERAGGEGDNAVLLMLSDGVAGDQREVVRGSYAVTGAMVPLVGGAAGENLSMEVTYQYAEGRVMANGLVAVWINSPAPLGIGVEHGWHPIGNPMFVTHAENNVIFELDGRPAVDAYLAACGTALAVDVTFAHASIGHPLGLVNASGRFDVRHILGRTDRGAMAMIGYVSEQSVLQVMAGDTNDLVAAAGRAAADAAGQLERPPRGALVFSCAARVGPLGDRLTDERATISGNLTGVPVAGFFTYGEFARVTGSTGFHNATVVVLAV